MSVKLRFAPSPTGFIHVGNIRTALMNALLAHINKGHFILRLDDTDLERSTEEYAEAIKQDLNWLGLHFDESFKQSERMERYNAVRDELIAAGRLYPCYETAEELDYKRKRQMARGKPPVYDREGLNLSDEDKAKYESEGRRPHWRFKLDLEEIYFHDLIRGDVRIDAKNVSDPVLIRADGSYLYTLCSVIDDADYDITHIVRGEDHVTNTATQIQIFKAIGAKVPEFAHHPLLMDAQGEKLSKRIGGLSVRSLREEGLEPLTILSYLARIGTSDPVEARSQFEDIVKGFDIGRTSNSPARFSDTDMRALNSQILATYDFKHVKSRLHDLSSDIDADFWDGVKFNIKYLKEAKEWAGILFGAPKSTADSADKDYLETALKAIPEGDWSEDIWKIWTGHLKEKTGRKGKQLFMPLRQALTGMNHGPEMAVLISLLGRERLSQRLEQAIQA